MASSRLLRCRAQQLHGLACYIIRTVVLEAYSLGWCVAQWWGAFLACLRPWVQISMLPNKCNIQTLRYHSFPISFWSFEQRGFKQLCVSWVWFGGQLVNGLTVNMIRTLVHMPLIPSVHHLHYFQVLISHFTVTVWALQTLWEPSPDQMELAVSWKLLGSHRIHSEDNYPAVSQPFLTLWRASITTIATNH